MRFEFFLYIIKLLKYDEEQNYSQLRKMAIFRSCVTWERGQEFPNGDGTFSLRDIVSEMSYKNGQFVTPCT